MTTTAVIGAALLVTGASAASTGGLAARAHNLQSCLGVLSTSQRQLLDGRFGLQGHQTLDVSVLAADLNLSVTQLTQRERKLVNRLGQAKARGACKKSPVHVAVASSGAGKSAPNGGANGAATAKSVGTAAAPVAGTSTTPSWKSPKELVPLAIAAVALIGLLAALYFELRSPMRRRSRRSPPWDGPAPMNHPVTAPNGGGAGPPASLVAEADGPSAAGVTASLVADKALAENPADRTNESASPAQEPVSYPEDPASPAQESVAHAEEHASPGTEELGRTPDPVTEPFDQTYERISRAMVAPGLNRPAPVQPHQSSDSAPRREGAEHEFISGVARPSAGGDVAPGGAGDESESPDVAAASASWANGGGSAGAELSRPVVREPQSVSPYSVSLPASGAFSSDVVPAAPISRRVRRIDDDAPQVEAAIKLTFSNRGESLSPLAQRPANSAVVGLIGLWLYRTLRRGRRG